MQRTLLIIYSCVVLMPWHGSAQSIAASNTNPDPSALPVSPATPALQALAIPAKPVSLGDVTHCLGAPTGPHLTVTVENGVTVDWFDAIEGGEVLAGGASTLTFSPALPNQNAPWTKTYFAQAREQASGTIQPERTAVTLSVNPRPTASLSGGSTVCPGEETAIRVTLTGSAPWTFTWSDGLQQTSIEPVATRLVSPTNNVTYYLNALADRHCTAQFEDLGESVLLRVEPRLTATLTTVTTNVCSGDTLRLRVAFTGRGPWTVTWSDGSKSTADSTPALLSITPTNPALNRTLTTNLTLSKVSNSSCEAAASDLKGRATLNVFPRPTALVSGDASLCEGGTTSIQAALTGIGPWVVVWSDGVIQNVTASPAKRTVKPSATTEYRVTVLQDKNCSAQAEHLNGVATVSVLSRPTGRILGGATLCSRDSTDIQVELTGEGPWTVTWSDGLIQSNVLQSPLVRTVSGTNDGPALVVTNRYSLRALSSSVCKAQASDLQGEAVVRILSGPSATVTGTNTVCNGQPSLLQLALTGTGPWEVTWSDGFVQQVTTAKTNRLVTAFNPSGNAITSVSYTVTNLLGAGCSASTNQLKGRGLIHVQPKVGATLIGGGALCASGATTLSVELSGTAPWSLTWSDGYTQTTNGPLAIRVIQPTSDTNLFLTSVSDKNCQALPGDLVGSANITLADPPSAVVSGGASQCGGTTNQIEAALTGTGPWTLTWSDGLVQSNVVQSPVTRLVTLATNDTTKAITNRYFLVSLTSGDCQARPSDLTGEALLVTLPRPTVTVSGPSGVICAGDPAVLQVTLTGQSPWTVTWSDGEVETYLSSSTNRIVRPTKLSTFSVKALQDANCTALAADIGRNNVLVRVNPLPAAPTSVGDVTNILEGTLSSPLTVQTSATNILVDWFSTATEGTPIATSTNQFFSTNLVSGAYVYFAEARNAQSGCVSTNRTPITLVILPGLTVERLVGPGQLLSWFGSYQLQSTTNLFRPVGNLNWLSVRTGEVGRINRYTNLASEKEMYFRLFQP